MPIQPVAAPWVSYDDATKTLTLDNVSITLLDDIVIRVDKSFEGEDFTINLVGENKLDNWGGYYDIQMLEKNGIFTGTGSLSGSICAGKGITIEGGCEINADKISGCASDYSPLRLPFQVPRQRSMRNMESWI